MALLNLFALWRRHEQKTQRRKQKQKTEMRNSRRCAMVMLVGHLVAPAAVAVAVAVTVGKLIDFKCGCRCQQLCVVVGSGRWVECTK